MDDIDWNAAMGRAIDMAKDQLKKSRRHGCCQDLIQALIDRFEAEKIEGYEKDALERQYIEDRR